VVQDVLKAGESDWWLLTTVGLQRQPASTKHHIFHIFSAFQGDRGSQNPIFGETELFRAHSADVSVTLQAVPLAMMMPFAGVPKEHKQLMVNPHPSTRSQIHHRKSIGFPSYK